MSAALAAAFGFIIASAIWFALFSVSYRNWHEQIKMLTAQRTGLEATVMHLEQIVHPEQWLDKSDVAINIAKKERMYDRHPELVRPGSEVIRIDSELEEDDA
jgi:hypothetical protein